MKSLLTILCFLVAACMTAPEAEYRPCRCEVEACSPQSCTYTFVLDESCLGEVPEAEILVDDHVELQTLTAEKQVEACSRTEPGETSIIYVRGGNWIWGPIVRKCSDQGGDAFPMVLECKSTAPAS